MEASVQLLQLSQSHSAGPQVTSVEKAGAFLKGDGASHVEDQAVDGEALSMPSGSPVASGMTPKVATTK